ncbi:amino acid adenylation domain-containing protein [Actinomycetes bacterium KLBMP 9797]
MVGEVTPPEAFTRTARRMPVGSVPPPALSPVEQTLHDVWCEILNVETVGLDDDFFAAGGDSMVAIRVASACAARGARFDLTDLLRGRTIRTLARRVAATTTEPAPTAPLSLLSSDDRRRLPDDVVDAYPLTALQLGMLYHAEGTDSGSYHSVRSAVVNASFDGDRMRQCLAELVARHEALRTSFDLHTCDVPVARVHRQATAGLSVADHSGMSATAQRDAAKAAWAAEQDRKVDWRVAPMVRFAVTVLGTDAFRLTWSEHHALLDGWSSASLFAELVARYTDTSPATTATGPLPPFRDYVAAELAARGSTRARDFWTGYLAGPAPRGLTRGGRPADRRVTSLELPVSTEVSGRLRQIARVAAVPLKSLLLAVHAATLGAYTGAASEIVVGQVTHGRLSSPGGDRALGLFLNTVPLRVPVHRGSSSWLELAREAAAAEREMQPYRRYPLSDIQRAAPHRPPVDNLFQFTDFHVQDRLVRSGVVATDSFRNASDTHFPLTVEVAALAGTGQLSVLLQGRRDYWHVDDLRAFGVVFLEGLAALAAAPDQPPPRRRPAAAPPTDHADQARTTICDRIAATVRRHPDQVAVATSEDALPYRQLWLRSGAVAAALRGTAGTVVAVLLPRTPDLVVALLGVLRAGAVLLPIDPDQPALRIAQLLDDAGATAVVGAPATLHHASGRRAVDVTTVDVTDVTGDATAPVQCADVAYVLYTSGSTGTPKGVAVEHRALAAIADAVIDRLGLSADDVVLGWTTVAFDIAIVELLFALVAGARVELVTDREADDPVRVARRIVDGGVTVVQSTPSRLAVLVEAGWRGQATVVSAGEPLPPTLAGDLRATGCVVWNGYGPTEATIYATMHQVTGEETGSVPIGRPLPGVDVSIVDERGADVPPGVAGELLIGGVGVARGYLGQPALTADRFRAAAAGTRRYATGDIVRSRPDGLLEYRGRRDHQVKLHGVRIELAEVEAVVAGHPAVARAVAALVADDGRTHLVAHIQPAGDAGAFNGDALRRYLRERLPRAMVPARFHVHTALPLTPNGKVDRRRLLTDNPPAPPGPGGADDDPLREPWETLVATTWQQVLRVPVVRRQDNFFALGGDSLQVVRLIGRLSGHGASLDIADVLNNPTVAGLAAVLAGSADATAAGRQ